MATPKKVTPKKEIIKDVVVKKKPTTEDLILGNEIKDEKTMVITYEHPSIKYKVTNLRVKNKPMVVSGDSIETFIGSNNLEVRKALKSGAKSVTTKDYKKNDEYLIEVI